MAVPTATNAYHTGRRGVNGNYGNRNTYLREDTPKLFHADKWTKKREKVKEVFRKKRLATNLKADDLSIVKRNHARELVIVDAAVQDQDLLLHSFNRPGVDVLVLEKGGLKALANLLSGYQDLKALHLLSHAQPGVLELGGEKVDRDRLKDSSNVFEALNSSLVKSGDIFLYGCELGKGKKGDEFLEIIQNNTQLDIAASDDLTGNAEYNGDWELEITKGDIEATPLPESIAMKDFTGVLQSITFNNPAYTGGLKEGQTITASYSLSSGGYYLNQSTTFKWYASDTPYGTKTQIGTNNKTLVINAGQVNKFLSVKIDFYGERETGSCSSSFYNNPTECENGGYMWTTVRTPASLSETSNSFGPVLGSDITPPTVLTNSGINLNEGTAVVINSTVLSATDPDTDDATLIFNITSGVSNGRVELSTDAGNARAVKF